MDLTLTAAGAAAIAAAGRPDVPWPAVDGSAVASHQVQGDPAAWLGAVHEACVTQGQRQVRGAHYTPADLAAQVVRDTLTPLLMGRSTSQILALKIVDPACGAGAFLLAAHHVIAQALGALGHPDPQRAAVATLIGVDKDPWAAKLCALALALRSGASIEAVPVHAADALLGPSSSDPHADPTGAIDWSSLLPNGADAVIGNPPFLGGKRIRTVLGEPARQALLSRRALSGNTDLAAHFVHLAAEITRPGGRIGLLLTDTIAQGDTHRHGLGALVPTPLTIVRAQRSTPWPGVAKVRVAIVHAVVGPTDEPLMLEGQPVLHIGSHLRSDPLDHVPAPLPGSRPGAFIGCDLKGPGFLFGDPGGHDLALLDELERSHPAIRDVVRPYVCGATLTRRPSTEPRRFVADLSNLDLGQATAAYPQLMALLAQHLPSDRATRSPAVQLTPWWRFWRTRGALRQAIAPLDRCLVAPVVSRYLQWSWQPTDRVFNHKVVVVATDDDHVYGALQCRLHDHWARALSSTLGEGLNYTPSRCYATYPLPPRSPAIAAAAVRVEIARQIGTTTLQIGRSKLQSLALDAANEHPDAARLRDALTDLDHAVLDAWGWTDLDLDDVDACLARLLQAHRSGM